MSMLKVLVVDDTRLARQELRTLLAGIECVECVGEADDALWLAVHGRGDKA